MEIVLMVLGGGLAMVGLVLVFRGPRRRPPPPLPPAKINDGTAHRSPSQRSWGNVIGGLLLLVIGGAMGLFGAMLQSLKGFDMTKGRLLRVRGRARLPAVARGDGWHDEVRPDIDGLSLVERAVMAQVWLYSARMEHASVPAFSMLAQHLTALGAPSHLVERALRAGLDELRHTRRCFAIARAYGGTGWTAGPIDELTQVDVGAAPVDLVRLAIGSLIDGAVPEAIAAEVALAGSRRAVDPVVRDALAMIADDERAHAELAWDVVGWCHAADRRRVGTALAERAARLEQELMPQMPPIPGIAATRLAELGMLDGEAVGRIAAAVLETAHRRLVTLVSGTDRHLGPHSAGPSVAPTAPRGASM
jgi:hypothetical protein